MAHRSHALGKDVCCIDDLKRLGSARLSPMVRDYHNIPGATGLKFSPSELAGLSKAGLRYLKDTSGDGPALTELLFDLSDQITAFTGCETLPFYGLAAGARGGIWGAANIIPSWPSSCGRRLPSRETLRKTASCGPRPSRSASSSNPIAMRPPSRRAGVHGNSYQWAAKAFCHARTGSAGGDEDIGSECGPEDYLVWCI